MNTYKVLEVEHLTQTAFRLRAERPNVPIKAGQCFNVGIPGSGVNREYSMYSGADDPYLDFLIQAVDGGCVSPRLQQLKTGDSIEIDGPYGEFCLRSPQEAGLQYLFIATGTGIAPFHSFVQTYKDLDYTILHGIRRSDEQYGAPAFLPGRYIPCVSGNSNGQPATRVTDFLRTQSVSSNSIVYLCGNRNMIVDAFEILRDQGVPGDNLFTEVFF